MVIIHMVVAKKMRNIIYKYGFLVLVSALSLLSFSPLVNAGEYGLNSYNQGPYSTYSPTSVSSGSTQAYRANFVAQQQALVQQPTTPTTTPTITPTSTLNIFRVLRITMTGNDVKSLQTHLNGLGYNCGIADGSFGPKTKLATVLFQKANSLTPDGVVGPMTIEKINNIQIPTITPTTVSDIDRTLKQGMTGNDVKSLQTYLNANGYDCGTPDGDFGPKTKQSVINFQKANSLTPDGIVGSMTREKMK